MQAKTRDGRGVVLVAVHRVVHHGVLQVAQVDADLVAAAGVEAQLDKAVAARRLAHLVVGDSQFAAVVDRRGEDAVLAVGEPRAHLSPTLLEMAPGNGDIAIS